MNTFEVHYVFSNGKVSAVRLPPGKFASVEQVWEHIRNCSDYLDTIDQAVQQEHGAHLAGIEVREVDEKDKIIFQHRSSIQSLRAMAAKKGKRTFRVVLLFADQNTLSVRFHKEPASFAAAVKEAKENTNEFLRMGKRHTNAPLARMRIEELDAKGNQVCNEEFLLFSSLDSQEDRRRKLGPDDAWMADIPEQALIDFVKEHGIEPIDLDPDMAPRRKTDA